MHGALAEFKFKRFDRQSLLAFFHCESSSAQPQRQRLLVTALTLPTTWPMTMESTGEGKFIMNAEAFAETLLWHVALLAGPTVLTHLLDLGVRSDYNDAPEEEDDLDEEGNVDEAPDVEDGAEGEAGGGKDKAAVKRVTTEYMTKYERARVLGTRALQISMGAPPMV
jgi:hypothetical protein